MGMMKNQRRKAQRAFAKSALGTEGAVALSKIAKMEIDVEKTVSETIKKEQKKIEQHACMAFGTMVMYLLHDKFGWGNLNREKGRLSRLISELEILGECMIEKRVCITDMQNVLRDECKMDFALDGKDLPVFLGGKGTTLQKVL